jgi:hypothetical protein
VIVAKGLNTEFGLEKLLMFENIQKCLAPDFVFYACMDILCMNTFAQFWTYLEVLTDFIVDSVVF